MKIFLKDNWFRVRQYIPDILILLGVWIFVYNFLRPHYNFLGDLNLSYDYWRERVWGVMLVAVGIDVAIRRWRLSL